MIASRWFHPIHKEQYKRKKKEYLDHLKVVSVKQALQQWMDNTSFGEYAAINFDAIKKKYNDRIIHSTNNDKALVTLFDKYQGSMPLILLDLYKW